MGGRDLGKSGKYSLAAFFPSFGLLDLPVGLRQQAACPKHHVAQFSTAMKHILVDIQFSEIT